MANIQEGIRRARKNGVDDRAIAAYLSEREDIGEKVKKALADPDVTATDVVNYFSESEYYRAGEKSPAISRGIATAMQGPTLGFGRKIQAATTALLSPESENLPFGEAYQRALDYATGQTESFRKEYPLTSVAAQGAASLPALALAPARLAQGAGYLTRTAQAGGLGAGFGAAQAAGESRFGLTSPEFLKDVQTGAKYGLLFGTGTQAALPALSAVARGPARQIASRMPGVNFAKDYAEQKAAQAILRGMPEAPGLQPLTQAQAKLVAMGPEARMADVSQATRDLLDVTATLPGRTRGAVEEAIRQRQIGAGGRMQAGAEAAMGQRASTIFGTTDDLIANRKNISRPYYAVTDKANVTVDDDLLQLLKRAKSDLGKAEGLEIREFGSSPDLSNVKIGDVIPFRVLDQVKKTVDDVASKARREGATNDSRISALLSADLRNKLIEISPKIGNKSAYQMALEGYAGQSKLIDAIDVGRGAFTSAVGDIKDAMKGMTPGELDAFRLGAVRGLQEKAGTEAGRTQLLKFWKEPNTQERLKLVFGKDYRRFAATLLQEGKLKPFESVGRGSQTARRQAGMADIDVAPLGVATDAAVAAKTGAVSPSMVQQLVAQLGRVQVPEPVRNELGRILLSRDPADFDRLRQVMERLNATQRRQVIASGLLGGQAAEKWFLD